MMKARSRFLCRFCNIVIISEQPTVGDALLAHLPSCMGQPKRRVDR